jgi:hypothetical protein
LSAPVHFEHAEAALDEAIRTQILLTPAKPLGLHSRRPKALPWRSGVSEGRNDHAGMWRRIMTAIGRA